MSCEECTYKNVCLDAKNNTVCQLYFTAKPQRESKRMIKLYYEELRQTTKVVPISP